MKKRKKNIDKSKKRVRCPECGAPSHFHERLWADGSPGYKYIGKGWDGSLVIKTDIFGNKWMAL